MGLFRFIKNIKKGWDEVDAEMERRHQQILAEKQAQADHYAALDKKKEERKKQCNTFTIDDMQQFPEIPIAWNYVMDLSHTDGVAWFMLNWNNREIVKQYIATLNDAILDAHDYVEGISNFYIDFDKLDFDYPKPMQRNSMTLTRVECYPYTATGKISKHPVVIKFATSEMVKYQYGDPFQIHPVMGEIKILKDGSIGAADVTFATKYTKFQFRLFGLSLVLSKIRNEDGVIFDFNEIKL